MFQSVFINIQKQIDIDEEFAFFLRNNADVGNYDLNLMIPEVTYDDWVVCKYLKDDKYYRLDENEIIEVTPIKFLKYDEEFNARDENGNLVSDEDLYDYCDCLCCGEADDMSCFVYFN